MKLTDQELYELFRRNQIDGIGQAIYEVVNAFSDIERIRKYIHDVQMEYQDKLEVLKNQLRVAYSKCPHLTSSFEPDASGNNDSALICDRCGQDIKGK